MYTVGICQADSCDDYEAWAYVLNTDIKTSTGGGHLSSVVYTTTSVDDGVTIDTAGCDEDTDVSPTIQTWTQTDTTITCSFDCKYDVSKTILYQK